MSTENKINSNFYQVAVVDGNADVTGLTVADITATTSANLGTVTAVTITGGINGQVLSTDGSGNLSWATAGGTPGGTDTQVQFNSGGVFAGDPGFTYNTSTQTVTLGNTSTSAILQVYANSGDIAPLSILPDSGPFALSARIKAGTLGGLFTDYGSSLLIEGGNATASSTRAGGAVLIRGGVGDASGSSGNVELYGGGSAASGLPGNIIIQGGTDNTGFNIGGNVSIYGGTGAMANGTVAITANGISLTNNGSSYISLAFNNKPLLLDTQSGSTGEVLTSQGSGAAPIWSTVTAVTTFNTSLDGLTPTVGTSGAVTLAGTLGAISGGTSQSTYATGDILYASTTNTLAKRAAGATGTVLTMSGGVPTWATPSGGQDLISYSTCGGA